MFALPSWRATLVLCTGDWCDRSSSVRSFEISPKWYSTWEKWAELWTNVNSRRPRYLSLKAVWKRRWKRKFLRFLVFVFALSIMNIHQGIMMKWAQNGRRFEIITPPAKHYRASILMLSFITSSNHLSVDDEANSNPHPLHRVRVLTI